MMFFFALKSHSRANTSGPIGVRHFWVTFCRGPICLELDNVMWR